MMQLRGVKEELRKDFKEDNHICKMKERDTREGEIGNSITFTCIFHVPGLCITGDTHKIGNHSIWGASKDLTEEVTS